MGTCYCALPRSQRSGCRRGRACGNHRAGRSANRGGPRGRGILSRAREGRRNHYELHTIVHFAIRRCHRDVSLLLRLFVRPARRQRPNRRDHHVRHPVRLRKGLFSEVVHAGLPASSTLPLFGLLTVARWRYAKVDYQSRRGKSDGPTSATESRRFGPRIGRVIHVVRTRG